MRMASILPSDLLPRPWVIRLRAATAAPGRRNELGNGRRRAAVPDEQRGWQRDWPLDRRHDRLGVGQQGASALDPRVSSHARLVGAKASATHLFDVLLKHLGN